MNPGNRNTLRAKRREFEVDLRQHPTRCALIDVQALGLLRERRGDLHAAGAGSDHSDSLAAGVIAVVPCVGPQDGAFEVVDAVDVDLGFGVDVAADGADQESRRHRGLVANIEPPQFRCIVPLLLHHFGVGLQVFV
ncbi:MAG: hypothetical protein JWQ31_2179 [Mycobacterium sp.]|nr:hypothetical protein [Mycobacterium sp.]